ncbi:hypothetical protein BX070DRAFT_235779 [Coemansia spiralis]|nr:hypothetical protein BX070DRAFT_235779 [Coemansia spiralis]
MVDSASNGTANIALFIVQIVSAVSGFVISASCLYLRKWHPPIAYTAAFHISFWIGIQAIITHTASAISVRLPGASEHMQNTKPLIRFLVWAQFAMPLWFVFLNVAIATDLMLSQLLRLNLSKLQSMHRWYLPVASLMAFTLALPLLIYHSEYRPSANVFSVQFPSALSVTLYYILAFDLWIAIGIVYCFVVVGLVVSVIIIKLRRKRADWNEHNLAQLESECATQSATQSVQAPKRAYVSNEHTDNSNSGSSAAEGICESLHTSPPSTSRSNTTQSGHDEDIKDIKTNTSCAGSSASSSSSNGSKNNDHSGSNEADPETETPTTLSSANNPMLAQRKSVLFVHPLPVKEKHQETDRTMEGRFRRLCSTSSSPSENRYAGLARKEALHISGSTAADIPNAEAGAEPNLLSTPSTLNTASKAHRRPILRLASLPPPFLFRNSHRSTLASQATVTAPFRIPTLALVRLLLYPLIPILSFTLMCVVRWVWFRSTMPSRWEVLNVVSGVLRALEGFLCLIVFLLNPALNRSFREIRKRNTPTFNQ